MMNITYQRKGVSSNTQAGKDFEEFVNSFFASNNIFLEKQKRIEIGLNSKKEHAFDFGNDRILIECKTHTWTETGNSPSAKLKNWSEAMFLFYLTPSKYKKIFAVDMDYNQKKCKTLLEYFIEHYYYLIPSDVILIDLYTKCENYEVYKYDEKSEMHIKTQKEELWKFIK